MQILLCRTEIRSGYERLNVTHLSVFHSLESYSWKGLETVSSVARYAFSWSFSLKQETLQHT